MAAELAARGRIEMGVSMAVLAQRLGCRVQPVQRSEVPPHFRAACRRRTKTIFLVPSGYRPRDEFAIAHELLELHAPRVLREHVPAKLQERFCDRGAAALLLPRQQFMFSLHGAGWDVAALRRRWPWASWATIASRLVDLVPGAAASSWVDDRIEWWRGSDDVAESYDLEMAEDAAVRAAQTSRGLGLVSRGRWRVRAWRLASRTKRVVLAVARAA